MAAGWNKGKRRPLSEEHKRNLSLALKGNKNALGLKHTEEAKKKMSLAKTESSFKPWNVGVKAWNNGMKWPKEVKENISKGMVSYWIQKKGKQVTAIQETDNLYS